MTDWVCDAVARASVDHGITARLILAVNRHESLEMAKASPRQRWTAKIKALVTQLETALAELPDDF